MNPLHAEFNRLYAPHPPHAPLHDANQAWLGSAQGTVRAAVIELARPADWTALGALWRGVQADLELPAPAIAVNGHDGYQLWFSWQQGVPMAAAQAFTAALCTRYLSGVSAQRLRCWPAGAGAQSREQTDSTTCTDFPLPTPGKHPQSQQWSAFIAPDLAAVFADEPWLDRPPGDEAQAQLLARLQSMREPDFAKASRGLPQGNTAQEPPGLGSGVAAPQAPSAFASTPQYPVDTPELFLRAVLQDPHAPLALRVQAAAALLRS